MSRRRVSLRVRLTALYVGLFGGAALLLIAASYLLLRGHLRRTLPEPLADDALSALAGQYALAFSGVLLVAAVLGWIAAGRVLAPLAQITSGAREISRDRLDRRIALAGPRDELRELADTFDAMLDRLEAAFAAQDRFVANASHELRSPLTVIRAEAEVALADPDAGTDELRATAEAILHATDRMQALLEGLLTLATSQRGLARREPVDFADALRAAAHAVGAEARAAGVALRVDGGGSAWVDGDRELLQRLAENLLENGVRNNDERGMLTASCATVGERVVLRVVNSGPVVPADVVDRLVEPFERLGRRADRRGAGLGLSIVRAIAEAHGGELAIAARREGGLDVRVALPQSRSARTAPAGARAPAAR